jgi:hypothetical protein
MADYGSGGWGSNPSRRAKHAGQAPWQQKAPGPIGAVSVLEYEPLVSMVAPPNGGDDGRGLFEVELASHPRLTAGAAAPSQLPG